MSSELRTVNYIFFFPYGEKLTVKINRKRDNAIRTMLLPLINSSQS